MRDFRKLDVWRKAHEFVLAVYKTTETFPKNEVYGLTSQLRRACISIPANIAEGCGRGEGADKARFVQISMGSASEAEYHLLLARDLGFLDDATYERLIGELYSVKKMLVSFHQTLRVERDPPPKAKG